jgi:hypothetical protein
MSKNQGTILFLFLPRENGHCGLCSGELGSATSSNIGLPTSLCFVQIAFGDSGNPENVRRHCALPRR